MGKSYQTTQPAPGHLHDLIALGPVGIIDLLQELFITKRHDTFPDSRVDGIVVFG